MQDVLYNLNNNIFEITLNRVQTQNAFDANFLLNLENVLDDANNNKTAKIVVIKSNSKYFCAGADLNWMQESINYSEEENKKDALILARVINKIYNLSKPTIAIVGGSAFGGGVGLIAACDIVLARENIFFSFSEVKLGLIPAVISPYIIKAIGARAANYLFITGEKFSVKRACELGLVHKYFAEEEFLIACEEYVLNIANLPKNAIIDAKALVRKIENKDIDENLIITTAEIIAKKRCSDEAQLGIKAFLNAK